MEEGRYEHQFIATLSNDTQIVVKASRVLPLCYNESGVLRYEIIPLPSEVGVEIENYLGSGVKNNDASWDEFSWNTLEVEAAINDAHILAATKKMDFKMPTPM